MKFKRWTYCGEDFNFIFLLPMVNIVLLLLIFFILTNTFVGITGMPVIAPKIVTSQRDNTKILVASVSHDDFIFVGSKKVTLDTLQRILATGGYTALLIQADRQASLSAVSDIYDVCKRAGLQKVNLATTEIKK